MFNVVCILSFDFIVLHVCDNFLNKTQDQSWKRKINSDTYFETEGGSISDTSICFLTGDFAVPPTIESRGISFSLSLFLKKSKV
jgi:hypothetical protein